MQNEIRGWYGYKRLAEKLNSASLITSTWMVDVWHIGTFINGMTSTLWNICTTYLLQVSEYCLHTRTTSWYFRYRPWTWCSLRTNSQYQLVLCLKPYGLCITHGAIFFQHMFSANDTRRYTTHTSTFDMMTWQHIITCAVLLWDITALVSITVNTS